jgi:hypothetical protein
MKLFIDENVSRLVVDRLRQDGHGLCPHRRAAMPPTPPFAAITER